MKKLILLIFIIVCSSSIVFASPWKEIAPRRVYNLLKEGSGLWLIDVGGGKAFGRAHIEGAVNIPAAELATKHFPKQKILVLTDNSLGEMRARKMAAQLANRGQKRVFVLAGGLQGWRRAGLPVVGEGDAVGLLQVMPRELEQARRANLPLRLLDLRDKKERAKGPVAGAETVTGKDLTAKLARVRRDLERQEQARKKNLAQELRREPTTVLLFPADADAAALVQQALWGLAADVRYVEGGYLSVAPRQTLSVSNVKGCPTCPEKRTPGKRGGSSWINSGSSSKIRFGH